MRGGDGPDDGQTEDGCDRFLVDRRDSVEYWTRAVFDTARIGGAAHVSNQSIRGLLVRLGAGPGWWIVLSAVVVALAVVGMRRARSRAREVVLLNAFAGLLVSPVSWSHHWVWIGNGYVWFGLAVLISAAVGNGWPTAQSTHWVSVSRTSRG
ncbi:MAG: DUF2029 domain-containing protein [Kutzneria sp.]|nr:DUF2029 domain-containing protein [Kutzneria sp.]